MDDDLRQHETWNTFTQGLGEFIVAYSWADKAITFLLLYLTGGNPNRGLVALFGMGARAKCQGITKLAPTTEDGEAIAAFAADFEALTRYRNTLLHSCFEWHPTQHRFSLSNFGSELTPSIANYTQPKQTTGLNEKAEAAEAIANRVNGYLKGRGFLSAIDPETRRPFDII